MSERSEIESGTPGADAAATVRCFGCGLEPAEGVVHRRSDGGACPTCAARLVEAQPGLLPAAVEGAREEAEPVAAGALPSTVGRQPGRERFELLRGAGLDASSTGVPILDPGPPEPA